MANLRVEVARLKAKHAETVKAHRRSMSAMEAKCNAAVAEERRLNALLWEEQYAAKKTGNWVERDAVQREKTLKAEHERQIRVLEQRTVKAEERVRNK